MARRVTLAFVLFAVAASVFAGFMLWRPSAQRSQVVCFRAVILDQHDIGVSSMGGTVTIAHKNRGSNGQAGGWQRLEKYLPLVTDENGAFEYCGDFDSVSINFQHNDRFKLLDQSQMKTFFSRDELSRDQNIRVFHVWKRGTAEELIQERVRIVVDAPRETVPFIRVVDFLKAKVHADPNGAGDLQLEITPMFSSTEGRPDFLVVFSGKGGGLQICHDPFPFLAPSDGYLNS